MESANAVSRTIEQHWQRALQYLAGGQLAPARTQLEALQTQAPRQARTHLLAARIAWHENRIRDAARHALDAAVAAPEDPTLLCAAVEALLRVGEVVAARECLARPALAQAGQASWLMRLADFRQRLDENAESLALIERAVAAGAGGPDLCFHHGVQLYFNGRLAEAEAELEASLRQTPARGRAALALSRLHVQTNDHNHLDQIATGLKQVAKGTPDHAALEFAHYKELEDLGRYDEAWDALVRGNTAMRARNPYDATSQIEYLERLTSVFNAESVRSVGEQNDGPRPIFILGLARSGTTVLERMLGNHAEVEPAGELVDFGMQLHWAADTRNTHSEGFLSRLPGLDLAEMGRRYLSQTGWRAHGKRFFIDKQPPNWVFAGLIHAALPQAKILHVVRDPMDVCFSNWRAFFGNTYAYSYDMAALAAYHHGYQRTMARWHRLMPGAILDVPYADLVREPEGTLRKTFEHCGLKWEPDCLDMRRNATPVATLSAVQVRQPIHTKAFGEWRRHADKLAPLFDALHAQ